MESQLAAQLRVLSGASRCASCTARARSASPAPLTWCFFYRRFGGPLGRRQETVSLLFTPKDLDAVSMRVRGGGVVVGGTTRLHGRR